VLFVQAFAGNEAATETELRSGQAARLTSSSLVHAGDFKQHVARKDDSDPEFGGSLTLTHSDFGWALGDRLVWEDTNENLTLALQEASDGDAAGFNVDVFDPATLKGLESELAKVELVAAGGITAAVAALLFAKFYSAG
jgi:hypothetical protein